MKLRPRYKVAALIYLLFCGLMSSCVHGPVRYKTLGYHKYATVEFTKRSKSVVKIVAAPAGVITDTLVTAVDTPVVVVWSVPLVFTHGGPDAAGCMKDPWIGVITFPFWYPLQIVAVCVWPLDMYQEVFGAETGIFRDMNHTPNTALEPTPTAP